MKVKTIFSLDRYRKLLLCGVALFVSFFVNAGIEPEIKEWQEGDSLAKDSTIVIFDNKSFDAEGNPLGSYSALGYREYEVQNRAYIEVNEALDSCFLDTFSLGVYIKT
jgi:hypothetical protein